MTESLFRKKPVVVTAFCLAEDDLISDENWPDWLKAYLLVNKNDGSYLRWEKKNGKNVLVVHTLEGALEAKEGDYIVRGIHGEIYPVKQDIFKETYEPASTDEIQNFVNSYISDLENSGRLDGLTDYERTLVTGNIRAVVSALWEKLTTPTTV